MAQRFTKIFMVAMNVLVIFAFVEVQTVQFNDLTGYCYSFYNLDMVEGKFKNCLLENFKICQDHHKRRKRSKRLKDCAFYHFNICVKD